MVIRIPHTELSDDALTGLIDEFITRDSTVTDGSLTDKRKRVRNGLQSGSLEITFDPDTNSTQLWTAQELRRIEQTQSE